MLVFFFFAEKKYEQLYQCFSFELRQQREEELFVGKAQKRFIAIWALCPDQVAGHHFVVFSWGGTTL